MAFRRKRRWSIIATIYCYRMTSPSTCTTLGTPSRYTPLSNVDWSQQEKASERDRHSVFFTAVNPMDTRLGLKVEYDLDKPRIASYKKQLDSSSQHNILVQFRARSEKGIAILWNSITCNNSFKHTTQRFVYKKWYAWKLVKNSTAKCANHTGYIA